MVHVVAEQLFQARSILDEELIEIAVIAQDLQGRRNRMWTHDLSEARQDCTLLRLLCAQLWTCGGSARSCLLAIFAWKARSPYD